MILRVTPFLYALKHKLLKKFIVIRFVARVNHLYLDLTFFRRFISCFELSLKAVNKTTTTEASPSAKKIR